MVDDWVHIGSDLNLGGAARNLVASTFGMVSDLPAEVTAGCGRRVPLGSTSRLLERVSCLACRDYAHQRYLDHANQVERIGPMPGMTITAAEIADSARAAREIAMKFVEPGDLGPIADGPGS